MLLNFQPPFPSQNLKLFGCTMIEILIPIFYYQFTEKYFNDPNMEQLLHLVKTS